MNAHSTFSPGSRSRLTRHDLGRFSGTTLFDRLARAVCEAGCLPRKELYEAWELARRVRRVFRGGRIVDVGGGHGLLANVMLLLDDTSLSAVVVDAAVPPSHEKVRQVLVNAWPRLDGRVSFTGRTLQQALLVATDVVVSSHACGSLTDEVLTRAADVRARVAVLPCCHDLDAGGDRGLKGWLDGAAAVDTVRALTLQARGYRIWTQTIPADITPKNRLLMGAPLPVDERAATR
jgi:Methyltransferase domain